MITLDEAVASMTRRLHKHYHLDAGDVNALMAIPFVLRTLRSSDYLVREAQIPVRCAFVIDGFVYRQKLTAGGERQIVSLHVPGEFVDLQNLFLTESDHNIQALTTATIAEVPIAALQKLAFDRPAIGRALWVATLVEASIYREWLLSIGRRSALGRLAHLICEFIVRLEANGVVIAAGYDLPMTQEQLGDALGLTAVHINRILRIMQQDGLISREKRRLHVTNLDGLRRVADFNDRYLHLNQS